MKTIVVTFAVLLFLLTLLGSFGGSIRTNEPFYNPIPAVKEERYTEKPKENFFEDSLLRGPSMLEQINQVVEMESKSAVPTPTASSTAVQESFYQVYPEEKFEEKREMEMFVPEPFESDERVAAAPF